MSIFHFGKKVLEIGIRETIKILMVWRMKKEISVCEHKKKIIWQNKDIEKLSHVIKRQQNDNK